MSNITFKVKVVKLDEHKPGNQGFTIGKIYDAWGEDCAASVSVKDDHDEFSALFDGEWEYA